MRKFEIIYEDNEILLCYKPAGIATQTKRLGQQDMESFLKNYRAKKGEPPFIGIVHRLDQPVEGLLLFAKTQESARILSKQIQENRIGKYYYAVSAYAPKKSQGILEDYLCTDKKNNVTKVVSGLLTETEDKNSQIPLGAKKAKLEYWVRKTTDEKTLFDIKLYTGRQHQIRVQMAHMGCPLLGDEKYTPREKERSFREPKVPFALCSYRLQFQHPLTKKQMDFCIVPKGEGFENLL